MINDSAPGLAVKSMRGEMRDLRRTIVSGQHMTEELQSLVIDLNARELEDPTLLWRFFFHQECGEE